MKKFMKSLTLMVGLFSLSVSQAQTHGTMLTGYVPDAPYKLHLASANTWTAEQGNYKFSGTMWYGSMYIWIREGSATPVANESSCKNIYLGSYLGSNQTFWFMRDYVSFHAASGTCTTRVKFSSDAAQYLGPNKKHVIQPWAGGSRLNSDFQVYFRP